MAVAIGNAEKRATTGSEFINSDGTPASWIKPIPRSRRWIHFALRAVPGSVIGVLIIVGQARQGTWVEGLLIGGVVLFTTLGWAWNRLANAKPSIREYATHFEAIPDKERYRSATKWLVAAFVLGSLFTWALYATNGLTDRWGWALACFIAFGGPGVAILTQRRRRVLTPSALKAKSHYLTLEKSAAASGYTAYDVETFIARMYKATFVRAFGPRGSRYMLAVAAFGAAWYVALEAAHTKNTTAIAVLLALVGLALAWDAVLWLIGAAIAIGIFVAIFKGFAALPVSVAIIIGALIIASSNERR